MLKSGIYLTFYNSLAAVLGLLRNVIVARLISVEDFGIASTFATAMALIDMSANIGINRLIVQAKDGHSEEFQASLHGFQVFRGFVGGALIFALAQPLATLFHTPQATWAYQFMALMPIVKGFSHLDMNRFQRERKFMPAVISETGAQAFSTVLALGFGYWLHDYRAMLFALLGQVVVYFCVSQVFAVRKYKIGWNHEQIRHAMNFGWPLLLNGFLMFGIFHGDRMIIGNHLGVGVLGWYSVAFMLTLMPTGLIAKVLDTLCLPVLARHQDDPVRFKMQAGATLEAGCLIGVMMAVGFSLLGGPVTHLLFGTKHTAALQVLILLSVMQAIRVAKTGPSVVAIAQKATTNPMIANVMRVLFLPLALLALNMGYDVTAVVYVAIVGEAMGLAVSFGLLVRNLGFDGFYLTKIFLSLMVALAFPLAYELLHPATAFALYSWFGLLIIVGCLAYIAQLPNLRRIALLLYNNRHAKGTG
jgi:O-antigen/teichoic acid export membrane protein